MKTKNYEITGWVYGNYWGGGKGAYPAEKIYSNTLEEGIEKAKQMLDNGSLDSGMGYESLLAARLDIKETTKIKIDEQEFSHEEHDQIFIGNENLSEEEVDFLIFL